jgi:thioredoxin 1
MNSSSFFCRQILHDKKKNRLLYSFFFCTLALEIIFCRKSIIKEIMTLEEYKDVTQLHTLANEWIEDYEKNNLGKHSAKLKKQYKEMQQLLAKTKQLIEKQSGEVGGDLNDDELEKEITRLGKSSPAFASCFGDSQIPFDSKAPVSKETADLAVQLKKLTATWYGKFSDSSQDNSIISLIASIHDQAKKIISAPKTLDGDQMSVLLYHTKGRDCRKMVRNVETMSDELEGSIGITLQLVEDEDNKTHELGIENFPAILFKRGGDTVATHEGYLSLSALQQKVGILLTGSNFSDSSSVDSVKDFKSVNQKELYSIGEHLLFYFTIHNCGHCKRITPTVEKVANFYHKVKFEQIEVNGNTNLHTSFGVNKVPALVFVHDGKVVGKHTGFIDSSGLKRRLEEFAISNKKNIGTTTDGEFTIIDKDLKDPEKGRKIKDKNSSVGEEES